MTQHPLIPFLRARLDEREQLVRWVLRYARESYAWQPPERWVAARTGPEKTILRVQTDRGEHLMHYTVVDLDYMTGEALANYLCSNDPAYVLADIAAKRKLLDWIERTGAWAAENNLWTYDEVEPLKILAEPFASHPDYPKDQ